MIYKRNFKCEHVFPASALTQDDLDYFARYIQLNFTVLENSYFNQKLYQSEIMLTNNGVRTLPSSGWEIYFSQVTQ